MTQSAFQIHMGKALKELSDRFKSNDLNATNPINGVPPPFVNEYVSRIAAAQNLATNTGPDAIIDVQFDFRNPLLYVINCITKEFSDFQIKPHPCLSPMSLIGYSLGLLYSLALLNDDENVRTEKSTYAKEIVTDRLIGPILNDLRQLHVPPFMEQLLASTTVSKDDRKPNLKFVYSLACFDYKHDFGRCFPINIFFEAHHCIATRQTNAPVNDTLIQWLATQVMAVPAGHTISQYFGLDRNDLDDENWLSGPILQAFNPVTTRTVTLRPLLNRTSLKPQNFPDRNLNTLNPYAHLMCLDSKNFKAIRSILNSLSVAIKEIYPSAKRLSDLQRTEPNQQLLNHYYQGIIEPTYHMIDQPSKLADNTRISAVKQFLVKPKYEKTISFKQIESDNLLIPALYRSEAVAYDKDQDPIKFKTVNPNYPPIDCIRHFIPNDYKPQAAFQNLISGKLIEIGELDSVAVPHINPYNSIIKENSFFLESALPMHRIRPIIPTTTAPIDEIERTVHSPDIPAVRIDLLTRQQDRIPSFGPYTEIGFEDTLPGYHDTRHIPHTQFACNSISLTINTDTSSVLTGSEPRLPFAWSSYRYLNATSFDEDNLREKKFMLLNFRTLFGLNVTLKETEHVSNVVNLS